MTIEFNAIIYKVQTLVDGGIRLTLDLPEDIRAATELMQAKQQGAVLAIAALPLKNNRIQDDIRERKKRKSEWATSEKPGADGNP